MTRHLDLLVVGAGPAGVAAALTASGRGLTVSVIDGATFPRDKTCGDGLTTGALRLLEQLGLPRSALGCDVYEPVHEAILVSPSGRQVVLPMPAEGEHAGVISRLRLDAMLVDLARTGGVDIREGDAMTRITPAAHGVEVETESGERFTARFVIAADGHFSPVRRAWQNSGPALGEWHAARQYFSGVSERRLWVAFERDLLPGYAWVFPLPGNRANVGFGVLREGGNGRARKGRELKELWVDLLDRPVLRNILGPDAVPEDRARAWPIPTRYDPAALADGRVLFVGDAAAVVDPMTGEGIAQALETGMLAALAVADGAAADPQRVGDAYRRAVARTLGSDLRFAGALQRLLAHPLAARAAIRTVATNDWTRRNFARWMFEDYPRAALFTPRRWRRHLFTSKGAYATGVPS